MTNLEPTLEILVVQATHLNINIGFSRRILNYSMTKSCTCVKVEVENVSISVWVVVHRGVKQVMA